MSIVGRKGKLSLPDISGAARDIVWERLEDVLTADVFGAYRYLPLRYGLLPFLTYAKDERGDTLSGFLHGHGISLQSLNYAKILFWPRLEHESEPDLLILLGTSPDKLQVALMVEVKLHSPQSEFGDTNTRRSQIGHYMIEHLKGAYGSRIAADTVPETRPFLYITRHSELPNDELERGRKDVLKVLPEAKSKIGLFWCSWRMAAEEARRLWGEHKREVNDRPWVRLLLDLWQDLKERDLLPRKPFQGIPPFAGHRSFWRYVPRFGIAKPPARLPALIYEDRKSS